MTEEIPKERKISWSQYKLRKSCPYKHKLIYLDGEDRDPPSKYTDYGTSIHNTAEDYFKMVKDGEKPDFDVSMRFVKHFVEIAMPNAKNKVYDNFGAFKKNEIKEWGQCGKESANELVHFIEDEFLKHGWKVFEAEYALLCPISDKYPEYYFNGFIDLVLQKDDKFIIIDYKSCSWGWGKDKIGDKDVIGQVQAYAHYFMKQNPELVQDISQISTAYILVKRTAKSNNRIERLAVTSNGKSTEYVIDNLNSMIDMLIEEKYPLWGLFNGTCTAYSGCRFYKTDKCKKS